MIKEVFNLLKTSFKDGILQGAIDFIKQCVEVKLNER